MNSHAPARRSPGWLPPRAQAEPAGREAFLRTILHHLPVGVCWQPCAEGEACWVNEPLMRLTGLAREAVTSLDSLVATIHADDQAAFAAGLAQLRTGQADEFSVELRCGADETTWWRQLSVQAHRAWDRRLTDL